MSRSRKHITSQLITTNPEPTAHQSIVRVVGTRGTNQVEVEFPNEERVLVMMPTRFQKLVWTKKNDFLIITTDRSDQNRGKFKGIIEHILLPAHIKHLRKIDKWPKEFDQSPGSKKDEEETKDTKPEDPIEQINEQNGTEENEKQADSEEDEDSDDESEEGFVNTNRIVFSDSENEDDSEEDESDDDN
jgi:hypothetical protein